MDANSGRCVVALSEFAAKTAAFILMEVYGQFRLRALRAIAITHILALDLVSIFGNGEHASELRYLF